MDLKLKLVSNKKASKELGDFSLHFLPAIFFTAIIILTGLSGYSWIILSLIPLFIAIFALKRKIRTFYPDWVKEKDIIGEMIFSTDKIILRTSNTEEILSYVDLLKIDLNYNFIQGEPYTAKDILHNGLATFLLTKKNGDEKTVKFLVENREQLNQLADIFKTLYSHGIKIIELMGRDKIKTILFKRNWKYTEIQELKSKLNIESKKI